MIKRFLLVAVALFLPAHLAFADNTTELRLEDYQPEYLIVTLTTDGQSTVREIAGIIETTTVYKGTISKGDKRGVSVEVVQSDLFASHRALTIAKGDKVVVITSLGADGMTDYQLVDAYRLPSLWWLAGVFFALAIAFGGWRGLTSVLGLTASALVIVLYIVPRIVAGADALWVSLIGGLLIATVSLFLAHGFNKRTGVAYAGTILTLLLSSLLAVVAVSVSHLFGTGSEESLFVLGDLPNVSLKGLLLGGIMLGLLGVLDDITTAQSAVVDELKQANSAFTFSELYRRGISVGREHIASLINTLFLAYAGASLPLFLLFSLDQGQSFWMIFNNQMIAEEIVRTLVGSACLILAVPITTALAAYAFRHQPTHSTDHHHHH